MLWQCEDNADSMDVLVSASARAGLPEAKSSAESRTTVHTAVVQTPVAVASNLAWPAAV